MAAVTVKQTGTAQTGKVYVGSSDRTIQSAVNYLASRGGGTLFIEAGSYVFNAAVVLPSGIEIYGEGDATVLQSGDAGAFTADGERHVHVHDLLFDGSSSGNDASRAIHFTSMGSGADNSTAYNSALVSSGIAVAYGFLVEDCTVTEHAGEGLYAINCAHSTFRRNRVAGGAGTGIRLQYSISCSVDENFVTGNSGGVLIFSCEDTGVSSNIVEHTFSDAQPGISVFDSNGCSVAGNVVRNCRKNGLRLADCPSCIASGNLIANNGDHGIELTGVTRDTGVTANVLLANDGDQLQIYNSRGTIAGNLVAHGGDYGIDLTQATHFALIGNVAVANSTVDIRGQGANNAWVGGNLAHSLEVSGTDKRLVHNTII